MIICKYHDTQKKKKPLSPRPTAKKILGGNEIIIYAKINMLLKRTQTRVVG